MLWVHGFAFCCLEFCGTFAISKVSAFIYNYERFPSFPLNQHGRILANCCTTTAFVIKCHTWVTYNNMYQFNSIQKRKLRKAIILFSKVGKNKQIRKMPITLVLTLLTSPFWALFVSLGCPDNISKNWDDIFSVFKIGKNDPLMSDFSFFLLCKLSKPCKLVMEMSLNGLLWYTVRL